MRGKQDANIYVNSYFYEQNVKDEIWREICFTY